MFLDSREIALDGLSHRLEKSISTMMRSMGDFEGERRRRRERAPAERLHSNLLREESLRQNTLREQTLREQGTRDNERFWTLRGERMREERASGARLREDRLGEERMRMDELRETQSNAEYQDQAVNFTIGRHPQGPRPRLVLRGNTRRRSPGIRILRSEG